VVVVAVAQAGHWNARAVAAQVAARAAQSPQLTSAVLAGRLVSLARMGQVPQRIEAQAVVGASCPELVAQAGRAARLKRRPLVWAAGPVVAGNQQASTQLRCAGALAAAVAVGARLVVLRQRLQGHLLSLPQSAAQAEQQALLVQMPR